jgi:hypothetical protein
VIFINGQAQNWASITVVAADIPLNGFTSITYGDNVEESMGYGLGPGYAPQRRSTGKYTVEPTKLKGYRSDCQQLRQILAARAGGLGYANAEFVINISTIVLGPSGGEIPLDVVLFRCRLLGETTDMSEGTEILQDELTIQPMYIARNGLFKFNPAGLNLGLPV